MELHLNCQKDAYCYFDNDWGDGHLERNMCVGCTEMIHLVLYRTHTDCQEEEEVEVGHLMGGSYVESICCPSEMPSSASYFHGNCVAFQLVAV